jgi:hypothetical protein
MNGAQLVPADLLAQLAANPALLADVVDAVARLTGCGNTRRAAGTIRGKRAGRRSITEDDRLLQHVGQLIADGKTPAEALKMTAAAAGGHSYAATLIRLRRKWSKRIANGKRSEQIIFRLPNA